LRRQTDTEAAEDLRADALKGYYEGLLEAERTATEEALRERDDACDELHSAAELIANLRARLAELERAARAVATPAKTFVEHAAQVGATLASSAAAAATQTFSSEVATRTIGTSPSLSSDNSTTKLDFSSITQWMAQASAQLDASLSAKAREACDAMASAARALANQIAQHVEATTTATLSRKAQEQEAVASIITAQSLSRFVSLANATVSAWFTLAQQRFAALYHEAAVTREAALTRQQASLTACAWREFDRRELTTTLAARFQRLCAARLSLFTRRTDLTGALFDSHRDDVLARDRFVADAMRDRAALEITAFRTLADHYAAFSGQYIRLASASREQDLSAFQDIAAAAASGGYRDGVSESEPMLEIALERLERLQSHALEYTRATGHLLASSALASLLLQHLAQRESSARAALIEEFAFGVAQAVSRLASSAVERAFWVDARLSSTITHHQNSDVAAAAARLEALEASERTRLVLDCRGEAMTMVALRAADHSTETTRQRRSHEALQMRTLVATEASARLALLEAADLSRAALGTGTAFGAYIASGTAARGDILHAESGPRARIQNIEADGRTALHVAFALGCAELHKGATIASSQQHWRTALAMKSHFSEASLELMTEESHGRLLIALEARGALAAVAARLAGTAFATAAAVARRSADDSLDAARYAFGIAETACREQANKGALAVTACVLASARENGSLLAQAQEQSRRRDLESVEAAACVAIILDWSDVKATAARKQAERKRAETANLHRLVHLEMESRAQLMSAMLSEAFCETRRMSFAALDGAHQRVVTVTQKQLEASRKRNAALVDDCAKVSAAVALRELELSEAGRRRDIETELANQAIACLSLRAAGESRGMMLVLERQSSTAAAAQRFTNALAAVQIDEVEERRRMEFVGVTEGRHTVLQFLQRETARGERQHARTGLVHLESDARHRVMHQEQRERFAAVNADLRSLVRRNAMAPTRPPAATNGRATQTNQADRTCTSTQATPVHSTAAAAVMTDSATAGVKHQSVETDAVPVHHRSSQATAPAPPAPLVVARGTQVAAAAVAPTAVVSTDLGSYDATHLAVNERRFRAHVDAIALQAKEHFNQLAVAAAAASSAAAATAATSPPRPRTASVACDSAPSPTIILLSTPTQTRVVTSAQGVQAAPRHHVTARPNVASMPTQTAGSCSDLQAFAACAALWSGLLARRAVVALQCEQRKGLLWQRAVVTLRRRVQPAAAMPLVGDLGTPGTAAPRVARDELSSIASTTPDASESHVPVHDVMAADASTPSHTRRQAVTHNDGGVSPAPTPPRSPPSCLPSSSNAARVESLNRLLQCPSSLGGIQSPDTLVRSRCDQLTQPKEHRTWHTSESDMSPPAVFGTLRLDFADEARNLPTPRFVLSHEQRPGDTSLDDSSQRADALTPSDVNRSLEAENAPPHRCDPVPTARRLYAESAQSSAAPEGRRPRPQHRAVSAAAVNLSVLDSDRDDNDDGPERVAADAIARSRQRSTAPMILSALAAHPPAVAILHAKTATTTESASQSHFARREFIDMVPPPQRLDFSDLQPLAALSRHSSDVSGEGQLLPTPRELLVLDRLMGAAAVSSVASFLVQEESLDADSVPPGAAGLPTPPARVLSTEATTGPCLTRPHPSAEFRARPLSLGAPVGHSSHRSSRSPGDVSVSRAKAPRCASCEDRSPASPSPSKSPVLASRLRRVQGQELRKANAVASEAMRRRLGTGDDKQRGPSTPAALVVRPRGSTPAVSSFPRHHSAH
jgi:hypothetical protein